MGFAAIASLKSNFGDIRYTLKDSDHAMVLEIVGHILPVFSIQHFPPIASRPVADTKVEFHNLGL